MSKNVLQLCPKSTCKKQTMIYDEYLRALLYKGKRSLYLKGGDLEYKKRYGSNEDQLVTFKIYRNEESLKSEEQGKEQTGEC